MMATVCVICGADSRARQVVAGANGAVCFSCLAEAFAQVARTYGTQRGPADVVNAPDATRRCLFCDEPITSGSFVAYRPPFHFCGDCLEKMFGIALEPGEGEPIALVRF